MRAIEESKEKDDIHLEKWLVKALQDWSWALSMRLGVKFRFLINLYRSSLKIQKYNELVKLKILRF